MIKIGADRTILDSNLYLESAAKTAESMKRLGFIKEVPDRKKLAAYYNYDFLTAATGKSADDVGKSEQSRERSVSNAGNRQAAIRDRMGDCAPSGAVYYPNYFRWFDQSMWALFAENGASISELESRFVEVKEKDITIVHELTRSGTLLVKGTDYRFWGVRSPETGKLQRLSIPEEVAKNIR